MGLVRKFSRYGRFIPQEAAGIALCYFEKRWRRVVLYVGILWFLTILAMCWMTETPLYLLSKGRVEDFKKTMTQIAKTNGRSLKESWYKFFDNLAEKARNRPEHLKKPPPKVTDILHRPIILKRCAVITVILLMSMYGYYLCFFAVEALSANIYLNSILHPMTNLAGTALQYYTTRNLKRKTSYY